MTPNWIDPTEIDSKWPATYYPLKPGKISAIFGAYLVGKGRRRAAGYALQLPHCCLSEMPSYILAASTLAFRTLCGR